MPATILPHRGVTPRIHPEAFIADNAVVIGDVEIGAGSSVWYGCVIRGDVNKIRIGSNTNLQDGTVVHCNQDPSGADYRESGGGLPCLIGDDITIGHMALIHACSLESGCFIGMRAVVMDRAVVAGGAMVAAGALVSPGKKIPERELWAGSPARRLREVTPADLAEFDRITKGYVSLGAQYRAEKAAS